MINLRDSFKWFIFVSVICILGIACSDNTSVEKAGSDNWPQFRGQSA